MDTLSLEGAQLGDFNPRDVAQNIYNISQSIEQVTNLLNERLDDIDERVKVLERAELQHNNERQAMTRLITMLASEARTVQDTHELLERQLTGDKAERTERRRYLDTMLSTLIALGVLNALFNLYRVFRRSGRAAQP